MRKKFAPKAFISGRRRFSGRSGSRVSIQNPVRLRVCLEEVRVTNVAVEHEVKLMDFTKWLDRTGGSPRGMSDRKRIK